MKKIIITSVLAIITGFTANAQQLDKGAWLVGGSLGFESAKIGSVNTSTFYLNPNVGTFLANKVAAGLAFSYYNSSTTLMSMGPFMRGYIQMGKAYLFGHLRFEYTNVSGGGISGDQFGMGAGPALGVFLNDNVGLEGIFDYHIPDFDNSGSSIAFNIGLQVYLHKD